MKFVYIFALENFSKLQKTTTLIPKLRHRNIFYSFHCYFINSFYLRKIFYAHSLDLFERVDMKKCRVLCQFVIIVVQGM